MSKSSHLPLPEGVVLDESLPVELCSPADARLYIGRRVCQLFSAEDLDEEEPRWLLGTVTNVKIEDETPYLQVDYDGGGRQPLWWEDFRTWAMMGVPAVPNQDPTEDGTGPWAGAAGTVGYATQHPGPRSSRKRHAADESAEHPDAEPHSDVRDQQQVPEEQETRSVRRRLDLVPEDEAAAAAPQVVSQGNPSGGTAGASRQRLQRQKLGALNPLQQTQLRAHAAAAVRLLPPPRHFGGPDPWPAGHLHRIQLVNFMCHDNLELLFGKHVTFVAGNNGSGKSALLQGLQACLGTSARETGRGTSLGEWVKLDRQSATVTLEVWNAKEEECAGEAFGSPFRYELYGAIIRIVRKITVTGSTKSDPPKRTGAGTYHLYRADGSEVKPAEMGRTAAREVAALTAHFNVDASNPLVIITQDKSREFHEERTEGACKKYEMYMNGTCLAAVRDMLAKSSATLAAAEANVRQHRERVQKRREELKALEERLKLLQRLDDLKRIQLDLERAIPWAAVAEVEDSYNLAQQHAAAGPARLAQLQLLVEEAKQAVVKLKSQEADTRAAMEGSRANLHDQLLEANARHKAAVERQRDLSRQAQGLSQQLNQLSWELQELEKDLRERQSGEAAAQRLREHKEKVNLKNAELMRLQAELTALEPQLAIATAKLVEAKTAKEDWRIARDEARARLNEADASRRELEACGGGTSTAVQARRWGQQAVALMRAVQAAPPRTFSSPPIGPLGLYLQRRAGCDRQMANVLEVALADVLDAWLFNTREDSDALKRLARSMSFPCPRTLVVPYRDRPHAYDEQPVVDENGFRWQRIIDLVAPGPDLFRLAPGQEQTVRATVINCLLDSARAATTVLVADRAIGQAVAQRVIPVLAARNIRRAFDMQGAKYEMRGTTMSTTSNRIPSVLRLTTDNRSQLEDSAREMERRKAELCQLEEEYRAASAAVKEAEAAKEQLGRQHMSLETRAARCDRELESLLQEAPVIDTESQTAETMNQIQEVVKAMQRVQEDLRKLDIQKKHALEDAGAAQSLVQELTEQSAQYNQRRQELINELSSLAEKVAEAEALERSRLEEVKKVQNDIRKGHEKIAEEQTTLNQCRAAAKEACSREEGEAALQRLTEAKRPIVLATFQQRPALLKYSMTSRSLSTLLDAIMRNIIQQEEEVGGHSEAVQLQAGSVRAALSKDLAGIDAVTKKVETMREAHIMRTSKYNKLRTLYDHLSNVKFMTYMQRRSYEAKVELDHTGKRLELQVRKLTEQHRAASLLQLSGGERSFTTSSFLLAMGEVVDTPFRAMDEYDVFMDADRRKMVTIALLDFAWRVNRNSQLLLFSPQDTATLTESLSALVLTCTKEGEVPPPQSFMKITVLPDPRDR